MLQKFGSLSRSRSLSLSRAVSSLSLSTSVTSGGSLPLSLSRPPLSLFLPRCVTSGGCEVLLAALQHALHHVIVVIAVHRRSRQPVLVADNHSACIRQHMSAYVSIRQQTLRMPVLSRLSLPLLQSFLSLLATVKYEDEHKYDS